MMENGFEIQDGVLVACSIRQEVIEVPSGVHTIGAGAFKGSSSIRRVWLPDSVRGIGRDAFKGCRWMCAIRFPKKLEWIEEHAFHRCHSLESVELPESVKQVGRCAFLYCDSLEWVAMPGVTKLGAQAFLNDVMLQKLVLSPLLMADEICDIFTGCGRLQEIQIAGGGGYQGHNAMELLNLLDAPPLVQAVMRDVFRMMEMKNGVITQFLTNIKHLELPEGITEIGEKCFYDKRGIVSVQLPESLTRMGSLAFANVSSLVQMEWKQEAVEIAADAFCNCSGLRSIVIKGRGTYLIDGLEEPTESRLSEEPPLVTEIRRQVRAHFLISGTTLIRYGGNESRVVVPDGIEVIGERAFAQKEIIEKVILPSTLKEIQEEAFMGCLNLVHLDLPEGIQMLGKSAMEDCVKLRRMDLPQGVVQIPESLCSRCSALEEVTWSNQGRQIGPLAFYGCNSLKQFRCPDSLERIQDLAFYQCLALKEVRLPASVKELGNCVFTGSGVRKVWMDSVLEHCGSDVFAQCARLTSLWIGEGAVQIGERFASKCHRLQTVSLPASLCRIGSYAFAGTPYQEGLLDGMDGHIWIDGAKVQGMALVPEGITVIAGGAFDGNDRLTGICLPQSLQWIGPRAFCSCRSLVEVVLPRQISVLEAGTFAYCGSLALVRAEGRIDVLKERVFYECSSLREAPVETAGAIGAYALYGCRALDVEAGFTGICEEMALEGSLWQKRCQERMPSAAGSSTAGEAHNVLVIGSSLIGGMGADGILIIPEGVTHIAPYAYYGNQELVQIKLASSLTKIGEGAFAGCGHLQDVQLPDGDWEWFPKLIIGARAFEKCISLKQLKIQADVLGEWAFAWCIHLVEAEISKAASVSKACFAGCRALKHCRIPSVEILGQESFAGCEALESVFMPLLKEVGVRAWEGCDSLRELQLPCAIQLKEHAWEDCGNLASIRIRGTQLDSFQFGCSSFRGCTALKQVWIGDNCYRISGYQALFDQELPALVRRIYSSAISCFVIEDWTLLRYQNSAHRVVIPDGIRRIAPEAFKDGMQIQEIVLPDSVEDIGARAFHGTAWMERKKEENPLVVVHGILIEGSQCEGVVDIPANVKQIAGWAFANGTITGIQLQDARTQIQEHAFRNCIQVQTIQLADGSCYTWNHINDCHKELPRMVQQIMIDCYHCFKTDEDGRLSECTGNIKKLVFPKGITSIGCHVFAESNLLTKVWLNEELTQIEDQAFMQCKWLKQVKGGVGVARIGARAFAGCIRLELVECAEDLSEIGSGAFENCTSLREIQLPEGMKRIPERAFYRCHQLQSVKLPSTLIEIGREAFAFCYALDAVSLPNGLERIESRAFAGTKYYELS